MERTCECCGDRGVLPLLWTQFYLIPENGKVVRKCTKCTLKQHYINQSEDEHFTCECGKEEDEMFFVDGKWWCAECFDKEFSEVEK